MRFERAFLFCGAQNGKARFCVQDLQSELLDLITARPQQRQDAIWFAHVGRAGDDEIGLAAAQVAFDFRNPGAIASTEQPADGEAPAGDNQAECLACHKPQAVVGYIFTFNELSDAAHAAAP